MPHSTLVLYVLHTRINSYLNHFLLNHSSDTAVRLLPCMLAKRTCELYTCVVSCARNQLAKRSPNLLLVSEALSY
jgi:hypothetical protein